MALKKKTYIDGVTVITGENLNDIQDAIIDLENRGGGGGEGTADLSILSPAVTGSESGNPVVLSDVSPLEHEVKVKLSGETYEELIDDNVTDYESGEEAESGVYAVLGVEVESNCDGSANEPGYHGSVWATVTLELENGKFVCFDHTLGEYDYGEEIPEIEYDCPIKEGDTIRIDGTNLYLYKTIEDFSGATVTKYGKNLFQYDPTDNEGSNAKVLEHGKNSITLQGLAGGTPGGNVWSNGWYYIAKSGAKVTKGVPHIFSCDLTILDDPYRPTTDADKQKNGIAISPGAASSGSANPGNYYTRPVVGKKVKLYQTFTPTCDSVFFLVKTCSATIKLENFQLEVGNAYTEYEPYQDPIPCDVEPNGEVKDIIGSGESMTLIADEGLSITADYNRDPNKVFADIYQKLSALGVAVMN